MALSTHYKKSLKLSKEANMGATIIDGVEYIVLKTKCQE